MSKPYSLNKHKYLTDSEFDHLCHFLRARMTTDRRNSVMILVALHTGARATELLRLRYQDLSLDDKSVMITGIKGSNDREIPLPIWLFKELVKVAANEGLIFKISYSRLNKLWHQYRPFGITKRFHSLRHTFAMRLYERTHDLRLVKTALGHRNIQNTMIYAEYSYAQNELRRLIV